ncbi:hypothetical protein BDU57DRAFT_446965 [Ampelomyces quisqualis]|uniref:Rhodopsin domain-containing protein n=1 Tax=Ampelomyces quisqualis TaxID=50730 RepID=A0A6A5QPY0_AMPQU|nr:hypothetical protein BDU57DRAFT_446965 [Ampelomyces quisqualis]
MATAASPPPFFITADDKRGLIVVTVALVLTFVWSCSLIGIWMRYKARDWKPDDWLLASATLVHTAQSGTILHLVNLGLGTSQDGVPQAQLERLGKEGIASQIFYVGTLLLSKCSVLCLYLRLSPGGAHKIASYGVVAVSIAWGVLAIVLIVVPCNPAQYYTNPRGCRNRWPKWQAISSLDIVTEAFIFGIAIQLVWTLQMRLKAKFLVVFAFSARLLVIVIAAIRLCYLHEHFLATDFTFKYIVATQWQMGYAIMSSTLTGIGPFLRPFDKEFTASYRNQSTYGHNSAELASHSRITDASYRQRDSWQSEGYLMHSLPSRCASKTAESHTHDLSTLDSASDMQVHVAAPTALDLQHQAPALQAPNLLKADANFRPLDHVFRHETEIWVGESTASFGTQDGLTPTFRDDRGLIIKKRTQVKIEIDRASCVI